MHLQATLLSRLLQHLPVAVFDRAVADHKMDKGHRALDARSHLVALIAGQLIEAHGLRDIEAVLASHAPALKRRRLTPACRSTLADANKARSPEAFEALIPALLARLSPSKARAAREALRLIDSTVIHPGHGANDWAHQNGKLAAKVHVIFDPEAKVPTFYEITSATPMTSPSQNRKCRSKQARPMHSILAITTSAFGPILTPKAAASSPA
jgi:hypothetical protein